MWSETAIAKRAQINMSNHQQPKRPRAQPQQRNLYRGSRSCPVRISGPRGFVFRPVNPLSPPRVPPNPHTHPLMHGAEVGYQSRGPLPCPPGMLLSCITTEEVKDEVQACVTPGPGVAPQHGQSKRQRMKGSEPPCRAAGGEVGKDVQVLPEEVGPGGGGRTGVQPTGELSSQECSEQKTPAEVGVGPSLKVTIQRSSESRAFSTGLEEPSNTAPPSGQEGNSTATDQYYCHLCRTPCHSQQGFQSHMSSESHQQRGMEVQNQSSARLNELLTHTHPLLQGSQADRVKGQAMQRWCATCQSHYRGDLILHRRTPEHKMCKQSSRPFCPACNRHFRTPRRFVEHMKSLEHKQQMEQLRQEAESDVLEEELITLDAVGCFEGETRRGKEEEEEEEKKEGEEKEEEEEEENSRGQEESRKEEEQIGESRIEIWEQKMSEGNQEEEEEILEEEENQEEEEEILEEDENQEEEEEILEEEENQEEEEEILEEEENQEEEEEILEEEENQEEEVEILEEEENQEEKILEEDKENQEDKMSVGGLKDSQRETIDGSSFVVPVSGFLCKLCHKFFYLESRAKLSHCRSPGHLHNVQKYNALRSGSSYGEDGGTHNNLAQV